MKQIRVAMLVVAGLTVLASAGRAAPGDDLLTGYSLTSWTDDAGRALGSVNAILQDRDGYLWVASDSGLLRFDGSRFMRWDRLRDAGVPNVPARSLSLSRDRRLWIGLGGGAGVGYLRGGRWTPMAAGLEGVGAVTELTEDADAAMWAIGDRVLYRLEGDRWRRVSLPWKDREGQVYHPFVDRQGALWIGTRWGVFRRDRGRAAFQLISDDLVWGLGEDRDGRIWMTDIAAGVRAIGSMPQRTLEGGGYRFVHDRDGNMWLATFGAGLWRVSSGPQGLTVKRAVVRTGLSSDSVQSIFEDRDGSLWIGTPAGLHRLTRRPLAPIDDSGPVLATEPAGNGGLWVGTAGGLLHRSLSPDQGQVQRIASGAPDIRTFFTDREGVLWMGTGAGLWRLAGGRLEQVVIPQRQNMFVRWLAPRARGGLWLGDTDWLYAWHDGRLSPLELPSLPATRRIRFASADRSGRVWLGFSGGGLGFIDTDSRLQDIGADRGVPDGLHQSIDAVFEDARGVVWIGGSGGLSRYADGRVVTLGTARGLPPGRVAAIVDDAAGENLWLTTERGLLRLRRSDVEHAVADATYDLHYDVYDAIDGLAGTAVGMIDATRTPDGALWFAQGGGLTHVSATSAVAARERIAPPPQIAAVVANDARSLTTTGASFPAGTRRLEILYSAPTLTDAKQVRFRYRLDGVDSDWVDAGTDRAAVYTNLTPGAYAFHVESVMEGSASLAPPTDWRFAIEPQVWETTWFYALCAAAAVAAAWAAWRARLRLAERQFALALAERARISRELHDTLLQSLVGVALQMDAISGSRQPLPDWVRQRLVQIREHVEEYIRDARQTIHDLRSPQLEEHGLAGALQQFGRQAVAATAIQFSMTTTGPADHCPPQLEDHVLRLGQEAIANAVRHASASRIDVELAYAADAVTLRVLDDGRGFDDERVAREDDHHFGLRTMRERAGEVGARLTVTSRPGHGTEIVVVAPRQRDRATPLVDAH